MSELFKKAYNAATQMYNSGSSPMINRAGGGLNSLQEFPVIKRVSGGDVVDGNFIGGYTDEMAGVEPDTTGVDYTVDGGADILGGQQRGKDQARQEDPDRDYYVDADPLTIDEVIRQRDMEIVKGQGEKPGEDYRDYLTTFSPRDLRLRGTDLRWSPKDAVYNLFNVHTTGKIKDAMDALAATRLDQRLKEEELPEPQRFEYTPKNFVDPDIISPTAPMAPMGRLGDMLDEEDEENMFDDFPSGPLTLKAAKGGGLSNINKTMMINGQPHKLAYINSDEASLLKAIGGSGRKVDGIPAYYFDDPGYMTEDIDEGYNEMTDSPTLYLSDDPSILTTDRSEATGLTSGIGYDPGLGVPSEDTIARIATGRPAPPGGPATGGVDRTDAELYEKQFKEGSLEIPTGTLDPRTYNTYLNDLIERTGDINEAERLLNESLKIPGAAEDMQARFDAGLFSGEGYRYGGPAGTLMDILEKGVNYDFADPIKKRLEKEEQRKDMEKETGILVDEKTKSTFGSVLDKVKDVFMGSKKLDQETIEGIQKDAAERGGTFNPISRGLTAILTPTVFKIAGALLGGRPIGTLETPSGTFVVGEDGSLVNSAIAASPNLGNEPTAKRTGTQTRTVATSQDESEDAPKTGIAGLLEKRPDTVSLAQASEPSIQNLISLGIDPQAAREMLGVA